MADDVVNSEIQAAPEEATQVDPATAAAVKRWTKNIQCAREHWEKVAFKRMRECMQLARDGADKSWVDANQYVVPIINRHINQAVSQLYAKNPKALAKRKPRRMFTVWDGKMKSLQEAAMAVQSAMTPQMDPSTGMPMPPPPPDPNAVAVLQDAMGVQQYNTMMDGIAETLTLLHNHYIGEKASQYKQMFKALVRRTKVAGVGYVKLGLQRLLEKNADITAKVADATEQIQRLERLMSENAREPFEEDNARLEELRTMLRDLETQAYLIVKEGPLLTFPAATAIIPDPNTTHLKTWTGAGWLVEEMQMTPTRIEEVYGKNVRQEFKKFTNDERPRLLQKDSDEKGEDTARVWRVECRDTGQEFTLCEGYPDWLKPPAPPEVKVSRFFTIYPLVFNETEDEDCNIFPPSDVWQARHIQREYNRSRQGLREHRIQNRPAYVTAAAGVDPKDLKKLQDHESGEIIPFAQLASGEKIQDKIMAKPTVPIDPSLYEVEGHYADLQRTVGAQQANLGGTSGDTATETSIAEQSRTVSLSDNVDDLDDLLSLLADGMGELMLRELQLETVQRIVGPGAVWPQDEDTRSELIEDISIEIRAGSSGRPNQAAEVAKLERAMPTILQLPNVNPMPVAERYFDVLEFDAEDALVEGLPSITALNALATKAAMGPQPGTGDPQSDPAAQGGKGGDNAPKAAANEPQSQPAFPAAAPAGEMQQNAA